MKYLPKLLFVVAFAPLIMLISPSALADDTNIMCPVLQDREATDDHVVTYKGKEVRLCCSECVMEFNRNPEIYENVLPQLQNIPLRAKIQMYMGDHGGLVVGGLLVVLLITLRIYRAKNPVQQDQPASGLNAILRLKISPTLPLLALAGYLGFEVYTLQDQLWETKLEDEIHFATFYDFGYPPVPRRPDTESRIAGSYYRGNDERSPKLFNNGNYRTAAFHISLCDGDHNPIETGDNVKDKDIFVKFEIDRPPFTPDFLYNQEMMGTMFLTAQCDRFLGRDEPVADAVSLTETEKMQKWEALFPIRKSDSCCCGDECRGTVYVCEKYFYQPTISVLPKRRGGSRFHYGLRYDLQFKDDVLVDASDVYMGALYRTRKLPTWRVPMTEWFSHKSIPVLPGENVDDPELLGLPEHLAKQGNTKHN